MLILEAIGYRCDDTKPLGATTNILGDLLEQADILATTSSSMYWSFQLISINTYLHMNTDTLKKKAYIKLNCCQKTPNAFWNCLLANTFCLSTWTVYWLLKHIPSVLLDGSWYRKNASITKILSCSLQILHLCADSCIQRLLWCNALHQHQVDSVWNLARHHCNFIKQKISRPIKIWTSQWSQQQTPQLHLTAKVNQKVPQGWYSEQRISLRLRFRVMISQILNQEMKESTESNTGMLWQLLLGPQKKIIHLSPWWLFPWFPCSIII